MKYLIFGSLLLITLFSCKQSEKKYTINILENDVIDTEFFKAIDESEKVLLSWYLYAYGNECDTASSKIKCELLDLLDIKDECANEHIQFLQKWFKKDILVRSKLQNCPVLPINFAIQNEYKQIILKRAADTISISFKIWGLNNAEEKSWNVDQTDTYLIKGSTFVKIEKDE